MNALRALLYADGRGLVNEVRRGVRSPARIAVWIGYLALLGFFFWSRTAGRGRPDLSAGAGDLARADYFICALLATFAFSVATGFGAVGIFRSKAEARFIIGSPVAAPLAIAYLQAREALSRGLRPLFSFIYFMILFGPRQLGPVAVGIDLILGFAIIAAGAAVVVPRRLLPQPAGIACAAAFTPLAVAALVPALRDAVEASALPLPAVLTSRILAVLPAWHPGRVLLEPHPTWLFAVLGVAAAAIAVLAAVGRDAYPELYALSIARIDRLERWQRRRETSVSPAIALRGRVAVPAPPGVLVFVWKSVVEFLRRTKREYIVGGALLCCGAGYVAARLASADGKAFFSTLASVVVNAILIIGIVGITATNTIAGEIRRPLFWIASAPLFERLCALALARVWTSIAMLELVAVSFALGGGSLIGTAFFALGLPALVGLLAAVGFATFALFPGPVDLRGPVTVLRLGLSMILLIPPFVVAVLIAALFGAALLGLGLAVVLAVVEGAALIGVAAWRLDGHVDRLAV